MKNDRKKQYIEELTNYIQENEKKLYRLAYSYSQDEETAFDILQEAITKAISKIHMLKEQEYMQTWFYRILINTSIDETKRKKKYQDIHHNDHQINLRSEEWEEGLYLYQKINELPPKLKTIVVLRFYEDKKICEIAKITNLNENTVKTRLYKALNKLKVQIQEDEDE